MNQYTAIYVDSWLMGSHMQHHTKMARLTRNEGESVRDMLERNFLLDATVFLFHGWPNEVSADLAPV
jgi:hypothetical protein